MPPPGLYFENDLYFFSGGVDATVEVPVGDDVLAGIDATAALALPTVVLETNS